MKQIILLLLVIINYSYSLAQNAGSLYRVISPYEQSRILKNSLNIPKGITYKGTPYHKPNFLIGSVYKDKKLLSSSVALRYNIYSDEIEVKKSIISPDSEAQVLLKSSNIFVQINGDIFYYIQNNSKTGKIGYFQILVEGQSINLYKKVVKEFIAEEKPSTSSPRGKSAFFKDSFTYYFVNNNGKFYKTPTSKKKVLKILTDDDGNLIEYINKNRINFKKEKDLKKFINYYNTL